MHPSDNRPQFCIPRNGPTLEALHLDDQTAKLKVRTPLQSLLLHVRQNSNSPWVPTELSFQIAPGVYGVRVHRIAESFQLVVSSVSKEWRLPITVLPGPGLVNGIGSGSPADAVCIVKQNSGVGTAFVIAAAGRDCFALTCAHVAVPGKNITLLFDSGATVIRAGLVAWDDVSDLAVLRFHDTRLSPLSQFGLSAPISLAAERGEEVLTLSFPFGDDFARDPAQHQGIVSNRLSIESNRFSPAEFLQLSFHLDRGCSGAPVIRKRDGRVVGVFKGKYEDKLALAIDIREAYRRFRFIDTVPD